MRICLVSQEYPPSTGHGGIGTQTWNKAHTLVSHGHSVEVLSSTGRRGPALQTDIEAGITVHRMLSPDDDPENGFPIHDASVYTLGYTWSVLRHLSALTEKTAFDLINFPEYGSEGFAFQLNRTIWNWVPVIVQLHGPLAMFAERIGWPVKGGEFHRVATFMEGLSVRLADGLMASSANIADFAAETYGIDRNSIDVVHCGIDCAMFRPLDEGDRVADRPTVLFVGNLTASKGLQTVLEAVLRLRAKYTDIRLQVLGRDDDGLMPQLQARARRDGADSHLEFLGFIKHRSDLPDYYRHAHVFAQPATHEVGIANVYVEAMACGCPVVASTTGGAPEAVSHEETGLLVPPKDVEATTTALDRILGDQLLRQRLSRAARRRTESYFSAEKYISRVLSAYETAIQRSREKRRRLKGDLGPDEPDRIVAKCVTGEGSR